MANRDPRPPYTFPGEPCPNCGKTEIGWDFKGPCEDCSRVPMPTDWAGAITDHAVFLRRWF